MILKGKDNMKGPMNKSILTMKNSSSVKKGEVNEDTDARENVFKFSVS